MAAFTGVRLHACTFVLPGLKQRKIDLSRWNSEHPEHCIYAEQNSLCVVGPNAEETLALLMNDVAQPEPNEPAVSGARPPPLRNFGAKKFYLCVHFQSSICHHGTYLGCAPGR